MRPLITAIVSVMLVVAIPVVSQGAVLTATCRFETGLSTYALNLDLTAGSGEIRYKFIGQDISYTAHIQQITDSELTCRVLTEFYPSY